MFDKNFLSNILRTVSIMLLLLCFLLFTFKSDNPLERYLVLSCALFCIGIYGIIASRNIVRVLMSIELLLNAVNINLVLFSNYIDPLEIKGQVFALFVMGIAACEAAIALAIILAMYRNISSVDIEDFTTLKW